MSKKQLLEVDDIVTLTEYGKRSVDEKIGDREFQIKYIDTYFRQYLICLWNHCFYVNFHHVTFVKKGIGERK